MTTRRPPHLTALLALGAVVLLLAVAGVDAPLRPVLTLVFFALGPGAAVLPRLGVRADPLLGASLAVAISVAVSLAVAQLMVWTGRFSPAGAVLVVLAVMVAASHERQPEPVPVPTDPTPEEVAR